jgi:hypothetical protein
MKYKQVDVSLYNSDKHLGKTCMPWSNSRSDKYNLHELCIKFCGVWDKDGKDFDFTSASLLINNYIRDYS